MWLILPVSIFLLGTAFGTKCGREKAKRSYLHTAYHKADVVMTGIVQGKNHDERMEVTSIVVSPRNVFKGTEYLKGLRYFNVTGIDKEPCPERLSPGDHRIFLMSVTGDDFLLEAPLLRLSLPVLDHLHTIAKATCEQFLCPIGSKCAIETGTCECKSKCRTTGTPVCGTDNVSYASFCHLSVRSCLLTKEGIRLRVASRGPCRKSNPCDDLRCGPGEECIVSQNSGILSAKCVCPTQCPNYGDSLESSAVCSSNGVDYPSSCHLKHHACETATNITVKYYGRCDPCQGFTCPYGLSCHVGLDRRPSCRCSEQCALVYEPVCANDGKTYTNECVMRTAACKEEREIKIWKQGKCEEHQNACQKLKCGYESECRIINDTEATCECHEKCPMVVKPVCATNGKTYDNECELKRASCVQKVSIQMKHQGTCGVGACSTFDACKAPQVCQVIDSKPKCVCPKCTDELMEVCASDGRTYANECKMRRAACLSKKNLFVKYTSICQGCEKKKCDFYSNCVVLGTAEPICKCPDNCPHGSNNTKHEVCGTDGVTYSSECHLQRSACQQKKFIVVAFQGKCDACSHVQCRYGEECRAGICMCSYNCANSTTPEARICAENGVIYPSECHLELASCQKGAPISEMPMAHCHSSTLTFTENRRKHGYGAVCDKNGKCYCPPCDVSQKYSICGSDGVIYSNQCELNTASCRDQRDIFVMPLLKICEKDKCECNRLGSFGHECDERGQCRCRAGVGGPKCDHCLPGFWGIHLISHGAQSCRPCGCSAFGSSRTDCEQTTGICECRPGTFGDKCNICPQGTIMTPSGCAKASEYRTPRDCLSLKCHHGAKCEMSASGFPDCSCPGACNLAHIGIAANMSVCASDGTTFDDSCELRNFACKHQIDLVPVSLGICEHDTFEILDRPERERSGLGSPCKDDKQCEAFNSICLTRPGHQAVCACEGGSKEENGSCIEIVKKSGLEVKLHEEIQFIKRDKISSHSKFEIQLLITSKNAGLILYTAGTDEEHRFEVGFTAKRRIYIRIGNKNLESKERLAGNVTITISWERTEVSLTVNGESQKHKILGSDPFEIKHLFIGGRRDLSTPILEGLIQSISIDDVAVRSSEIRRIKAGPRHLRSVHLQNSSFMKYEILDLDVRSKTDFEIVFKPMSNQGTVFTWFNENDAHSDFATLLLSDGKLFFVIDFGSGPTLLRGGTIELNKWTTVKITRRNKEITLTRNGKHQVSAVGIGKNSHLDLSRRSKFYIGGGVPDSSVMPHRIRKFIKPLTGIIHNVAINEFPLNLDEGWSSQNNVQLELEEVLEQCQDCKGYCINRVTEFSCTESGEKASSSAVFLNREDEMVFVNSGNVGISKTNESKIDIEFKTIKSEATLWFEGQWSGSESGDFFTLVILRGNLHVGVNLGQDRVLKLVSSNITVNDDQWTKVTVKRRDRKTDLAVNGRKVLTVVTTAGSNFLNTNGLVYLGGRDSHQTENLKLPPKFVGCMRKVKINNQEVNLLTESLTRKTPQRCHR